MKNKLLIVLIGIVCIIAIIALIIIIPEDNVENNNNGNNNEIVPNPETTLAPSKIDEGEKEVASKKKQELFKFIPKVYIEEAMPFSDIFMLDAAMNKIIEQDGEFDFSVKAVDNMVKKLFGKEANINKKNVNKPDIAKSLFYYSEEAASYAVIPVGYEGIYKTQILLNATETQDSYYVYTYMLIGGYSYDEDSIVTDEFGDVDYDKSKVKVVVGDKDGKDLVHEFDSYTQMYDENVWKKNYSNLMPVLRYTLKKDGNSYYLMEVEQIGY